MTRTSQLHPPTRRRSSTLILVALSMVLLLLLASSGAAHGAEDVRHIVGIEVMADDGSIDTRIAITQLYPGATEEAVFFLTGLGAAGASGIAIALSNLEDLDNGCNRPEINVGDLTCGDGSDEGELSDWLAVTYTGGTEDASDDTRTCTLTADAPSTTALMSDLAAMDAPIILPPSPQPANGAVRCAVVAFHHEERGSSDNLTQSDSVRFDLGITVTGDLPPQSDGSNLPSGQRDEPPIVPTTDGPLLPRDEIPADEQPTLVEGVFTDRPPGPDPTANDAAPTEARRHVVPGQLQRAGAPIQLGLPRTGSSLLVLTAAATSLIALGAAALRRRVRPAVEVSQ